MNTDSTISVLILNWSASQLCLSHHSQEPQINVHLRKVPWVNQSWISQEKSVEKGAAQEMTAWSSHCNAGSWSSQHQRPQNTKTWAENLINSELTERYQYCFSILCSGCSHPQLLPCSPSWEAEPKWAPLPGLLFAFCLPGRALVKSKGGRTQWTQLRVNLSHQESSITAALP